MAKEFYDATLLLGRIKDLTQPFRTFETQVPEHWTDFNDHMNEARYLDCFSSGSDALMHLIGCDEAYIKTGKSFFTVETHIRHLDEVSAGEPLFVTTQVLAAQGKKLHLFHLLFHQGDGDDGENADRLLASGEQLLLHVDLDSRRTSDPDPDIVAKMRQLDEAHKDLPMPDGVGRAVGQRA